MNILTLSIAAVVLIGVITIAAINHRLRTRKRGKNPYVEALHLILEGRREEAIVELKKTVKADTENIMAYIMLGNLFRESGHPIKAAKIHSNLLMRGDLDKHQVSRILTHLILDYHDANMPGKAIEMAERLAHRNKQDIENQQLLLSLYEAKGDWDKAFFCRQTINKWQKKQDQGILALYKVESGLSAIEKGAEREGRIRFREAIKLDKACIPAYLYWGDSYKRENRNDDAIRIWQEFTQKNPKRAHLAFSRLKETLFETGRYWEIEGIYQSILQKSKNPAARLELADFYRKQGQFDQAIELCQEVLDKHPETPMAWYILAQVHNQRGNESAALEEALEGLSKQKQKEVVFTCSECGNASVEPLWRCPQCRAWDSYVT